MEFCGIKVAPNIVSFGYGEEYVRVPGYQILDDQGAFKEPVFQQENARFAEFREKGQFTDFVLIYEEDKLELHSLILAGKCNFFYNLFNSGMVESVSKTYIIDAIQLNQINTDFVSVMRMIDFLYTHQLNFKALSIEELINLTYCANFYGCESLMSVLNYALYFKVLNGDVKGEGQEMIAVMARELECKPLLNVCQMMAALTLSPPQSLVGSECEKDSLSG